MCSIVNKARNVILWHLGKLLLKYTLEASEDDEAFGFVVIVNNADFYLAVPFFNNCRLGIVSNVVIYFLCRPMDASIL
jgi:hypothetical protein